MDSSAEDSFKVQGEFQLEIPPPESDSCLNILTSYMHTGLEYRSSYLIDQHNVTDGFRIWRLMLTKLYIVWSFK